MSVCPASLRGRNPERARIFIGHVRGAELSLGPSTEDAVAGLRYDSSIQPVKRLSGSVTLPVRHVVRKIREARVDAHLAVVAEGGWKQRDAALEGPVVAYPRSAGVPPVAVLVLKRVAVSRAVNETAGLVAHGVIRSVFERSQRVVGDVGAGGVDVVLGAGRTVLQVVAATMLGHPCALDVRRLVLARVIRPEPLPAMLLRLELDQGAGLADVANALLRSRPRACRARCRTAGTCWRIPSRDTSGRRHP